MAALMARKATGKGQWVEGALLATAVTFGNALLIEQAVIAPNRVPTGNRGQTAAPGRHLPHQGRLDPGAGDRRSRCSSAGPS